MVMDVWSGNVLVMVNIGMDPKTGKVNESFNTAACTGYEPGAVMSPLAWVVDIKEGVSYTKEEMEDAVLSFLPTGAWNTLEVDSIKHVEFPEPEDMAWSEMDRKLSKGELLKMSPLHVMTFYGALASGNLVCAHHILAAGRDVAPSSFGEIDLSCIISALDSDKDNGITGRGSISKFYEYDGTPCGGETFAGFFPNDEPEYAIVCAIFTGKPYSKYTVSGTAHQVAGLLAKTITAKMPKEVSPYKN